LKDVVIFNLLLLCIIKQLVSIISAFNSWKEGGTMMRRFFNLGRGRGWHNTVNPLTDLFYPMQHPTDSKAMDPKNLKEKSGRRFLHGHRPVRTCRHEI
jgi:hypothetical protein